MSEIAKHWIDGEWTGSGTISESVNPANGAVQGQWADGGEAGPIGGQNGQQGVGHLVRGHQRDTAALIRCRTGSLIAVSAKPGHRRSRQCDPLPARSRGLGPDRRRCTWLQRRSGRRGLRAARPGWR